MTTESNKEKNKIEEEYLYYYPNDIVDQKYLIIKRVDEGGRSSTIYLASDIKNPQQKYAIKVVNRPSNWSEEEWIKIKNECITSLRLTNRKNIVNTYEVLKDKNGKAIIFILEYIDGVTLDKKIRNEGHFNVKDAIFYFHKILEGVKELHSLDEKVIHRDLTLKNIMVTSNSLDIKLIDFGISSIVRSNDKGNNNELITHGEKGLLGTPPYVCPDLLNVENKNKVKVQCDFYSLGVIFYVMVMGELPFRKNDTMKDADIIRLPTKYDMISISQTDESISPAIENIIFRCLACKEEDLKFRYNSIDEIIKDIERVENNYQLTWNDKLLKPTQKRTFQSTMPFNISNRDKNIKFYERHWFYWLVFCIAAVVVIIVIVLVLSRLLTF